MLGLYSPPGPCRVSHGGPCNACTKIKEVESQILAAPHPLENLLEQHRVLRTEINRQHNPVILQVPPEIASVIFRFCVSSALFIWPSHPRSELAARLELGAVCRGWRHLAWSTPRLWTEITVRLNSRLSWQPDFLRGWLRRSGDLPLAIGVYVKSYRPSSDGDSDYDDDDGSDYDDDSDSQTDWYPNAAALVDILNEYSHRWQDFRLEDVPAELLSSFCGNSSSTSIIRLLAIGSTPDHGQGLFAIRNAIPRPHSVNLRGPRFKSITIGWENVTCVIVAQLHVHEYLELLRLADKLQTLSLDIQSTDDETLAIPVNRIVHQHLEELYIGQYDPRRFTVLFEAVVFPKLVNLIIADEEESLPLEALLSLLQRSACPLRELTIDGTYYGSSDIVVLLEHIPSLEHLNLYPPSNSDHFPEELFKRLGKTSFAPESEVDENAPSFLPRLRCLDYDIGHKYSAGASDGARRFPWDLIAGIFGPLCDIGNSRRRPLHRVQITLARCHSEEHPPLAIDEQFIPSFLSILQAGLKLKIFYISEVLNLMDPVHELWEGEQSVSDSDFESD